jgi:hypothetical protein
MSTYFELLDRASGTMLKDYDTEAEALDDLRAFGREHGQAQLQGLALLRISDDRPVLVAMDDDLITRVAQSEAITRRARWFTRATVLPYEIKFMPEQGRPIARRTKEFTATHSWALVCA